ncbi:MAG: PrgI family protein, partial [Patescibacteria group bacterium]
MQEHPVPQNITSYEFHLIGNMTLKQFFELAAGGLFAFLSYTSNLPDLLKWPLVFVFVVLGVAFAFVPLEERPLDHWFIAFIRAIYNPTKFYWKKTIHIPDVFTFTKNTQQHATDEDLTALPRKRARAEAYLQSISPTQKDAVEELDERAATVLDLFQTTPVHGEITMEHRHDE